MSKLSIVLITWNSERFIPSCLQSLCQTVKDTDCEVIWVDNGSTDSTRQLMAPFVEQLGIVSLPQQENLGVAKARNIGLRKAQGEYVWLLDIDTVLQPGVLAYMLSFMETHPACGICGCKLHSADGEIQDSCRRLPSLRYKILNVLEVLASRLSFMACMRPRLAAWNRSQFYHEEMEGTEAFQVEYLIGACQLIRRKVIEQIGLLDERIFYGPEDADFCFRASKKGWQIYYLPSVSFRHDYQKITNRRIFSRMGWVHTKALFYFFWKYKRF